MKQVIIQDSSGSNPIEVPESWNELLGEPRNPHGCMVALEVLQSPNVPLETKRYQIAAFLLGMPDEQVIFETAKGICVDYPTMLEGMLGEYRDFLFSLSDFMLEPGTEKNTFSLRPELTRCPFPALGRHAERCDGRPALYAPADGLSNITAWELALLFDLYEEYARTKDGAVVDRLIATMYRRSRPHSADEEEEAWFGDRRVSFVEASVPLRQQWVAQLPMAIKNCIFFWFTSCRQAIIAEHPGIFQRPDSRERQGADYGWWGIFRQVGGSIFDAERVSKMNYQDLLVELDWLEQQRLAREMASLR